MNLRLRITSKFLLQLLLLILMISSATFSFLYFYMEPLYARNEIRPNDLMRSIRADTAFTPNSLRITGKSLAFIDRAQGFVQVLDANGNEIYAYHKPPNLPVHYAPGQLVMLREGGTDKTRYVFHTWYDTVNGQGLTWVAGIPPNQETVIISRPFTMRIILFIVLLSSLLAVILIAFLFGIQLGSPILHIIRWLQNISQGSLYEPLDRKGNPRSSKPSGELRRSYRVYREVIDSLRKLTLTLHNNEEYRRQLEQTREEWIAGVSHDLKTPLTSIKGYAELLKNRQYAWSQEQVAHFGGTITEKSAFMEDLIEDLNLTFRLKNQALPLDMQPYNLIELVRRSVIDILASPAMAGKKLQFDGDEDEELRYPADTKWLKRAVDNLLVNAAMHNPQGTVISVHVGQQAITGCEYPAVTIAIADNGIGMDEQTAAHLFDRYYRGTNTDQRDSAGSGLGTAISKQIIQAHQGDIALTTAPHKGTTVEIILPAKN